MNKVTKREADEAKRVTLRVWRYLHRHPLIYDKWLLPKRLFSLIETDECHCRLCSLFRADGLALDFPQSDDDEHDSCPRCPLKNCEFEGDPFEDWSQAYYTGDNAVEARRIRADAAGRLVEIVKAWDTSVFPKE